jgi:hypothetical protein
MGSDRSHSLILDRKISTGLYRLSAAPKLRCLETRIADLALFDFYKYRSIARSPSASIYPEDYR